MKKHAEICPVCKGTGKYKEYWNYGKTTNVSYEHTCHGCKGIGWITVVDDDTPEPCPTTTSTNIVFSDTEEDMNKYFKEFCNNKAMKLGGVSMSFFEDYVEDGICCMCCGQVIDGEAVGYPRLCEDCEEQQDNN